MHKFRSHEFHFILLIVFFSGYLTLLAQVDFRAEPVSITASRLSTLIASETREVIVITKEEMENLPAESVSDVLRIAGVDVNRRGSGAVQSDLSLRGGSFEQVLVLLDGMRMNNPQTGHFNFDLPVSLSDIERIEILPGHSASVLGPDGYNGVIHIITRSGSDKESRVEISGGSFGTYSVSVSQTFSMGSWQHRLSAGKRISEGYREETDYDIGQFYSHHILQLEQTTFSSSIGWSGRDYGANGFYAPYPSREKTEGWTGQTVLKTRHSNWFSTQVRLSAHQHEDDFILDADRPEWYQNNHCTRSFAGEVQGHLKLSHWMEMTVGMERLMQILTSSRLGDHDRTQTGLFAEWALYSQKKWILNLSARLDGYDDNLFQINPSASFSIPVNRSIKWRVSAGRAYRVPTFTELFYESPANQGDSNLKPERAWSAETGLNGTIPVIRWEMTAFIRLEQNRIDWITTTSSSVWQVMNRKSSRVQGLSFKVGWEPHQNIRTRIHWQEILRSESSMDLQHSKYGFNATKQILQFSSTMRLPFHIHQQIEISYKRREVASEIFIMDAAWNRSWKTMTLSCKILNLLNHDFEEIPGVPMPGRQILLGIQTRF
ncbi:TonB-dependent receptor [candidate division KSB1 bacterium]|nr:TonB-dependent receptor [candidate division KSB1 bacterium]